MIDNVEPNDLTNSEAIAYKLMTHVLAAEGRPIVGDHLDPSKLSRNLILDAYMDCLDAVQGKRQRRPAAVRRIG